MAKSPMMRAAQPSQQGGIAQRMRATPAPKPMQAAARPTSMQPAAQPTLGQLDQMRAQKGMLGSMPSAGRMAPMQNGFSSAPQTVQMQGVQLPQGASQQALDQAQAQMMRDRAAAGGMQQPAYNGPFSAAPQQTPQNSFSAAPQNNFSAAPQTMPNFNAGPQNTFSASPQARLDEAQALAQKQLQGSGQQFMPQYGGPQGVQGPSEQQKMLEQQAALLQQRGMGGGGLGAGPQMQPSMDMQFRGGPQMQPSMDMQFRGGPQMSPEMRQQRESQMRQQEAMASAARMASAPAQPARTPGAGQFSDPMPSATQAPAAASKRPTAADALRYLRQTGDKAGADRILQLAVGKQPTQPNAPAGTTSPAPSMNSGMTLGQMDAARMQQGLTGSIPR